MSADDGDWIRTTGPSPTGTSGPPGGYPNGGNESEGSLKFGGGPWKRDEVGRGLLEAELREGGGVSS